MALAIDASTPALFNTSSTLAITSASFTPPAGSLLVLMYATNGAAAADASAASVTNTGTALTWTRRARKNLNAASNGGAGQNGGVEIWTAVVGASGAMTVTVTGSATGNDHVGRIQVITGADNTSLTNVVAASGNNTTPTATLTGNAVGSHVFGVISDWNGSGNGTAGTGLTMINTGFSQIAWHFLRTTSPLAAAGSQVVNVTAPTVEIWNEAVMEVRVAAAATPPGRPRAVLQSVNRAGSY